MSTSYDSLAASTSSVNSLMAKATARARLASIDALRGIILLAMLVDHVRETFSCITKSMTRSPIPRL